MRREAASSSMNKRNMRDRSEGSGLMLTRQPSCERLPVSGEARRLGLPESWGVGRLLIGRLFSHRRGREVPPGRVESVRRLAQCGFADPADKLNHRITHILIPNEVNRTVAWNWDVH